MPPDQNPALADSIHNFPHQATPFIGRADELIEISRLLADPECRLLSLVGAGGAGKTRLACHAAQSAVTNFIDGVYFVPLETLDSGTAIHLAIADSMGIHPRGTEETEAQLVRYLKDSKALLILDNFEHLVAAADLLVRLLEATSKLKLLVTSRQVLNLRYEWIFTVRGLTYPSTQASKRSSEAGLGGSLEKYDAIQLFCDRARQVRRDLSLSEELESIEAICQIVDGSPLALELAASWIRTLSCQNIAREIQRSINFLDSNMRDIPDRHRSLQAVFDQSWKMLNREEQSVFKRLSVFRGSFTYQAAEQVASASLPILASLTGKSLLSRSSNERFVLNQLLRSYAAGRLGESSAEVSRLQDLHCHYYTGFLRDRLEELVGGQQLIAAKEIEAELDNVRAAWVWAVDRSRTKEIKHAVQALDTFFQFQSRFKEGFDSMLRASESLERQSSSQETDLTLAEILVCQGWLSIRLGNFAGALSALNRSLELFTRYNEPLPPGIGTDPRIPLSLLASFQGDHKQAVQLGEQALAACQTRSERFNLSTIHYVLASAWSSVGDYEQANQHAKLACQFAREDHNRWMLAYCLNAWGKIELSLGNYSRASDNYRTSYEIRQEFEDPEGMAVALNGLGIVELRRGQFEQSRQFFARSLVIYQKLDDRGGLASTINGLAYASTGLGEYDRARREYHQALQITSQIQHLPLMIWVLIGIGNLYCLTGRKERGLDLLQFTLHHPASEREAIERSQEFIDRVLSASSGLSSRSDELTDHGLTLEGLASELLADLQRLDFSSLVNDPSTTTAKNNEELIDPLTDRELEVLELLAKGLANRDIAEQLFLSTGTVKWYTGQIYRKLQVSNRTQAVAQGRELGLLV